MSSPETYSTEVTALTRISHNKAVIRLRVDGDFSYHAGQYVELVFGACEPRAYSIANAPGHGDLEFHIKDNGRGGAGSYVLSKLQDKEAVTMKGPFGHCIWRDTVKEKLVLIAGGIGIVPLKAIAEEALDSGYKGQVTLYWGTNHKDDMYIDAEISQFEAAHTNMSYVPVMGGLVGEIAVEAEGDLDGAEIYLAGPPAMISATVPLMLAQGAAAGAIHTDQRELLESLLKAG